MQFKKTAIVILNYNGRDFLEKFLPLVLEHCPPDALVAVADNASSDDSVAFLQAHFPDLFLLALPQNKGYSAGYNEALAQIEAQYYVLLNSDIAVEADWLEPLVEYMDAHPETAACQPKIRAFHQPDCFEYAGAAGGLIDVLGYPFCRGRLFDYAEKDEGQYDSPYPLHWVSGAAMCVRAEIYRELGGLDEDFFAHMEEIDFCLAALSAGHSLACVPQSRVWHVGGGTLAYGNPRKTYLNFRNNQAMLYKNLPLPRFLLLSVLRFPLDLLAAFRFFVRQEPQHAQAILRALLHFWFGIGFWHRKKQARQAKLPKVQAPRFYPKSIVWEYFVKKRKTFSHMEANSP